MSDKNIENIKWIDSMKGIAMCMVVFIHCGASNLDGVIGRIGKIGGYGVTLFFLIYGYLASVSLERYRENILGGG